MTQLRHWQCSAAMAFMAVSSPNQCTMPSPERRQQPDYGCGHEGNHDVASGRASATTGRAGLQDRAPLALPERTSFATKAFDGGLRSLGYRVGKNVVIEYRFANADVERLPALAADLVRPRRGHHRHPPPCHQKA